MPHEPGDLRSPRGPRKNPDAVRLGRLGGRVRSPAKTLAVRENGKKGGRPKKNTKED
jgi:hypothetical protein